LNGGVVSNKGFIRQMTDPEETIIEGKYVSAWGGIQSAGQTVGQIVGFVLFPPSGLTEMSRVNLCSCYNT
jgi:hypothetical protein